MNILIKYFLFLFLPFFSSLNATQGLVTKVVRGQTDSLFFSLIHLTYNLDVELPIEVWLDREKISTDDIEQMQLFDQVIIRYLPKGESNSLLYILKNSEFDEMIWFSDMLAFVRPPQLIFEDIWYKEKGSFFFQNHLEKKQTLSKEEYRKTYAQIKDIGKKLRPVLKYIPFDFADQMFVNATQSAAGELHFASDLLVVINKKMMEKPLETALKLSQNKKLPYLNDIDLLWMGVALCQRPFHLNYSKEIIIEDKENKESNVKAQLYKGTIFAVRRPPIGNVRRNILRIPEKHVSRSLIDEEEQNLSELFDVYEFLKGTL